MKVNRLAISFGIPKQFLSSIASLRRFIMPFLAAVLLTVSVYNFWLYLQNGLGLSYNDARSHLDIGRRVVEGLKPGLAQLGSVWLPLNHLLMIPLIWNNWMWHSGAAGAVWNMLSFVVTGLVIYKYLEKLQVGFLGRLVGLAVFVANLNILYLQSTAMTEPLLLLTTTVASYYLLKWFQIGSILDLVKTAFWLMLSTLVRYDGWFLLGVSSGLIIWQVWNRTIKESGRRLSRQKTEGVFILFITLAATGIVGWFAWNQLIFRDALYFLLGPFSAHAQQQVVYSAGALPTLGNIFLSTKVYLYALLYNSYTYPAILAVIGFFFLLYNRDLDRNTKLGTLALWAPLFFNILALYLGFSVIFVQGISGNTWFNIRYGVIMLPTIAIFIGYLVDKAAHFKPLLIGSLAFVLIFSLGNRDSVALDDARVGSSQKNVNEVAAYLHDQAGPEKGFILISAASHDAIIFSSGLSMKRFIHEGTGLYWDDALKFPDRWARWIVMRTYDESDLAWKNVSQSSAFYHYDKVASYPFADVYKLEDRYAGSLQKE